MRFSIIYLISLLLVPTLVASKKESPPPPDPDPAHGDIVRYQGWGGPRLGVVEGSQRPPATNLDIAPLTPNSPHPPGVVRTYQHQVVNVPPGHVVRTGYTAQPLASTLERQHAVNRPFSYQSPGPVRGSPNYQAALSNGGNRPGRRTGGRRQA